MAQTQVGLHAQQPHRLANAVAGPSGALAFDDRPKKRGRVLELSSDSEDWGGLDMDEELLRLAEDSAWQAKRRKLDSQAHAGVVEEREEPVAGPAPRENVCQHQPAPVDDFDEACTTILSILADVDLAHVKRLFLHQTAFGPADVEAVLEELFSMEGGYPKAPQEEKRVDRKGNFGKDASAVTLAGGLVDDAARKRQQEDEEVEKWGKAWLDLAQRKPLGKSYEDAALAQLYVDFPRIQQHNMKRIFLGASSFYAPAYVAATKALRQPEDERGWKLMVSARVDKGKNKASPHDELEKEKRWVHDELHKYEDAQERVKLRQLKLEEEIASGAFFECGCCFTDTALSQIVTCTEGCGFCFDCARLNAESQIGMRKLICSNCRTLSCYICGKIIAGYQHFRNAGTNLPVGVKAEVGSTCDLWDSTEERNRQEVEAARMAAEVELRKRNAHIAEEDLAKLKMGDKVAPAPANIAHLPPPRVAAYEAALEAYRRVAGGANNANAVAGPANPRQNLPAALAARPVPQPRVQPKAAKKPKVKAKKRAHDPPAVAPPPRFHPYDEPLPRHPLYNPQPLRAAFGDPPPAPVPRAHNPALRDAHDAAALAAAALNRARQARKQVEDAREARRARTQGKK